MLWSLEAHELIEKKLIERIVGDRNPVLITDMSERIVGVNKAWVNMCKFSSDEAFGQTPNILQGPLTNTEITRSFSVKLHGGISGFSSPINYTKDGKMFINHLYGWCMRPFLVVETYVDKFIESCE